MTNAFPYGWNHMERTSPHDKCITFWMEPIRVQEPHDECIALLDGTKSKARALITNGRVGSLRGAGAYIMHV